MISQEKVEELLKNTFKETDVSDRIKDRGYAYCIWMAKREHWDYVGSGPVVLLKDAGEIYAFGSGEIRTFGAETLEEFRKNLGDYPPLAIMKENGDIIVLNKERFKDWGLEILLFAQNDKIEK